MILSTEQKPWRISLEETAIEIMEWETWLNNVVTMGDVIKGNCHKNHGMGELVE